MAKSVLDRFDSWLDDEGVAAVVVRQPLRPVEGADAPLFPPTYAGERQGESGFYNIDKTGLPDASGAVPPIPNVCLVDSVGSQANRIEPAFKTLADGKLVPQVAVDVEGESVHLLDAGHRVADAVVRFSDLIDDIEAALLDYRDGDAAPLARLAPTSLVFGAWDSRATQVKIPRLFASTIRAYDVQTLTRSAQYKPAMDYVRERVVGDPDDKKEDKDRYAEEGFVDVPATGTHGGVIARKTQRDATLNLATLRSIEAGDDDEATRALRRYLLGLALVALTRLDGKVLTLRQGCQLVADGPAERKVVRADGTEQPFELSADEAVAFAQVAGEVFGVGTDRTGTFDAKQAKAFLKKSSKDAKTERAGKALKRKKASS
ncbi:MAG: type I-U CRISPR-associated RAMP protein Csb1/Cas7u [Phycisphaeraceae bacterium]